MAIASLKFTHLGPFDEAEFEFDPNINVLVGPNNTGKTTALLTLAEAAIQPFDFPAKLVRPNARIEVHCIFPEGKRSVHEGPMPIKGGDKGAWGDGRYGSLSLDAKKHGFCAYVPAIRFNTNYRSKGPALSFEESRGKRMTVIETAQGASLVEEKSDYENPVSMLRDDRIVHEIINLDYRAYRENNSTIRSVVERIAALASRITEGFPIEFSGVAEDKNGYFLEFKTPDGKMPLSVLSQGTQSLLQWLGRLVVGYARHYKFADDYAKKPGVLIIDEIDAHLHPSWQRRILPALSEEFPHLQIFCSTHSPLMLAGLSAGQIHLLRRSSKGHVEVTRNEADVHGWSADEILKYFLGVSAATDLETESDLEDLRALRAKPKLSPGEKQKLEALRNKVQAALQSGPLGTIQEALQDRTPVAAKHRAIRLKTPATRKPTTAHA